MPRFNLKDLFRIVTFIALGFGLIAAGIKIFSLPTVVSPLDLVIMSAGAVVASTGPLRILQLALERFD